MDSSRGGRLCLRLANAGVEVRGLRFKHSHNLVHRQYKRFVFIKTTYPMAVALPNLIRGMIVSSLHSLQRRLLCL